MHNSKRSMDLSDTLFWHQIWNGNARALPCVRDIHEPPRGCTMYSNHWIASFSAIEMFQGHCFQSFKYMEEFESHYLSVHMHQGHLQVMYACICEM